MYGSSLAPLPPDPSPHKGKKNPLEVANKVNKVFSGPSLWFSPCLVSLKGSLSSARSVLLTYAWIRLSSLANTVSLQNVELQDAVFGGSDDTIGLLDWFPVRRRGRPVSVGPEECLE
ncbi:unnamed protein product [Boreogadus saida]